MAQINDYTEQTVLNDTDEFILQETAGGITKKTLLSTIKTAIGSYIIDLFYPVGSVFVQYPIAESNTLAVVFPTSQKPVTLFGGTWIQLYETEGSFFRTEGETATRTNGLQLDAMQRVSGRITFGQLTNAEFWGTGATGVFTKEIASTTPARTPSNPGTGGQQNDLGFDNAGSISPNTAKTDDSETRSKNRLIRIWKRTA